jgi:hypothetical protein|nr:MAG TPA: hypothetical protein [Caudoviricetes sp.]
MEYIDAEFLANIFLEKIENLANEAWDNHKKYFDLPYSKTQDLKAPYIDVVNFTPDELSKITPYIWRNIIASNATHMALHQLYVQFDDVGIVPEFMEDNIRFFLPKLEHHNLYAKYM